MEGYLHKRSGSLLRGFQKRYFIRIEDKLVYFIGRPADALANPRGAILLTEIQQVVPAELSVTDRRFDIKLLHSSKASRADFTFQMRANSKTERDAWIEALSVWINVRKYGVDAIPIPQRMYSAAIGCIKYCLRYGHTAQGIFRVPGNAHSIAEIFQYVCLYGENYFRNTIKKNFNVFDFASVLKKLMREFPEPLLTFQLVEAFVQAKDKETLQKLVQKLPAKNAQMLFALVFLCETLVEHTDITLMSAQSLAVCLGPCIVAGSQDIAFVNFSPLFENLIAYRTELFQFADFDERNLLESQTLKEIDKLAESGFLVIGGPTVDLDEVESKTNWQQSRASSISDNLDLYDVEEVDIMGGNSIEEDEKILVSRRELERILTDSEQVARGLSDVDERLENIEKDVVERIRRLLAKDI